MTFSIILLLLIIVALFVHNSTSYVHKELIYKGELLNSTDYPYVMYIQLINETNKHHNLCTGTLIKKLLVLTAGHCCYGYNLTGIKVCQGTPLVRKPLKVDYHKVVKKYIHEKFDNKDVSHDDICVLKLEKAFQNITTFSKIGGSPKDFANGTIKLNCTMIGFGATANKSRYGELGFIMTNDVVHGRLACKNPYRSDVTRSWEQFLCLVPMGKSKPCPGDSGGPLICNNFQYGLCSYGYPYVGKNLSCTYEQTQSVYIFIKYHEKWLMNIIEKEEKEKEEKEKEEKEKEEKDKEEKEKEEKEKKEKEKEEKEKEEKEKEEKEKKQKKKKKKKKRSSGNLLKPLHYSLYIIILTILLYNMLNFI